jgi:hypothetical protein
MGEWKYRSHIFLTSVLVGGKWSASRSDRFTPEERAPGTHWVGGWVALSAGLDIEKRKFSSLPGLELRLIRRPVRSRSLCRLRYPGSDFKSQWFVYVLHTLLFKTLNFFSGSIRAFRIVPMETGNLSPKNII